MTTKSLHAWVLHKRWSGDTSAHVTLFTREQGLLRGLCRGGRSPKKQSLLQAFIPLWVGVNERRDWHYIQQLEILAPSLPLTGSALFAGLYINELLHHILHSNDAYPHLYDDYVHALHALVSLTDRHQIEVILRRFEAALLLSSGYQVEFTEDMNGEAISPESAYAFIAGDGFTLASKGISGAHILAIADDKLNDIEVLKSAKWIMRRAIDHAVDGKPIKARELYGK